MEYKIGSHRKSKKSMDANIINGTETILTKLIIAVNVIESATSPSANLVSIFEVTPPGAHAININPKASSAGKFNNIARNKATIGNKII